MTTEVSPPWPVLSVNERRVLGVLVEKQKTTDTYPLTLNAIVTGSNQKSNREPMLDLEQDEVEEALGEVQKKGLVMRIISGRVDKWKHLLYDAWKVNSVELAVLTELLLRGPQTEGELRGRASRMDEIVDVDALRQVLTPLKERKLVVYLTPEGRRGTVVTHGFHDPHELDWHRSRLSSHSLDAPEPSAPRPTAAAPSQEGQPQLAQLRQTIEEMQRELARLTEAVRRIETELGLPTP